MSLSAPLATGLPAACLALAVLFSRFSGNDKAPFVVLLVLALNAGFVAYLLVHAAVARHGPAWLNAALAALPLLYALLVVLMARHGWVDSSVFLGFR